MSNNKRLLEQFIPQSYDIKLDITNKTTFYGNTIIEGKKKSKNNHILLHSRNLHYSGIYVNGIKAKYDKSNDFLKIYVSRKTDDKLIIELKYSSEITDVMHGLYPSYFKFGQNIHKIYSTQLESTYAREVFPCIDEPSAKASFKLSIVHDSNTSVISNTPIETTIKKDGVSETIFETTPIMSTYLLAFACGNIHNISKITKSGVKVSIWASKALEKNNLKFSLNVAIRVLEFYENYFGVKFPLQKIDHIAIPNFSSGAMENWGMITYREEALIVNSESSIDDKKNIAKVIAHELAHQWFGNLVTMRWWDDLWLNESFATYIEYLAIDNLFPKWKIWDDFLSQEVLYALSKDCFSNVQPVKVDVDDPDEISSIFDAGIVYAKGARLIGMIRTYLGDENFSKGLKNYFIKYKYNNATSNDLWNELQNVSNIDIKKLMSPWLEQAGYPIVYASEKNIKQKRFLLNQKIKDSSKWPIPLNPNIKEIPNLMSTKSLMIDTSKKYALNVSSSSHFITYYDKPIYEKLSKYIVSNKASRFDKIQFLNEQILLARAGIRTYSDLLDIISNMKDEKDYIIWDKFLIILTDITKIIGNQKSNKTLINRFMNLITKKHYEELGLIAKLNEKPEIKQLRAIILSLRNRIQDIDLLNSSSNLYKKYGLTIGDAETRGILLSALIKNQRDDKLANKFFEIYQTTNSPALKYDLVSAITSSKSEKVLHLILNSILDNSLIKSQDLPSWMSHIFPKIKFMDLCWQWIKNNWQELENIYKSDNTIDVFPKLVSRHFTTKNQLEDYKKFFKKKTHNKLIKRSVQIGIEEIDQKINIIDNQQKDLVKKLKDLNPRI